MKTFTKVFLSLFILISGNCLAQESLSISSESAVTNLEVKVTEIEELDTLDWDDIFQVFEGNAENQPIEIALVVDGDFKKKSLEDAKITFSNFNFTVKGVQADKAELLVTVKERTEKFKEYLQEFTSK